MILGFQCDDLSKILLVSKFEMDWPNIKLIIIILIYLYMTANFNNIRFYSQWNSVILLRTL